MLEQDSSYLAVQARKRVKGITLYRKGKISLVEEEMLEYQEWRESQKRRSS